MVYFSSPYISYDRRAQDRNVMLGALLAGDREAFDRGRHSYGVTHVLVREQEAVAVRAKSAHIVEPVYRHGDVTIFQVIDSAS